MRIRMLFFPVDLFKDESFIPAVWFWILGSANTEVMEETILVSD